jgi:hypothetical protein
MERHPWITLKASLDGNVFTKFNQSLFPPAFGDDLRPYYITIVGRKSKAKLLQHIYAAAGPKCAHNQVCLWSSSRFHTGQTAVVVIDCELAHASAVLASNKPAGTADSWLFQSDTADSTTSTNFGAILCDRVLAPFSSVVCYFVSNLGGQKAVAHLLASQAVSRPASDLSALPRILLVVETSSDTFDEILAESRALTLLSQAMQTLKEYSGLDAVQVDIYSHFKDIKILGLKSCMTASKRASALKKRLLTMSRQPIGSHSAEHFSIRHFKALSKQALGHLCLKRDVPFSFVDTSRPHGFSSEGFESCLRDCLDQMPSQAWLWHFVAPLVASALLLSLYPPKSHSRGSFSHFSDNADLLQGLRQFSYSPTSSKQLVNPLSLITLLNRTFRRSLLTQS